MIATNLKPICLPPAPLNGGRLETAPEKIGVWKWQPKVDDWRAVLHTPSSTLWNQYGRLSSFTDTAKFVTALAALHVLHSLGFGLEWLDVGMMENRHDMMRGTIIVLDLIVPALTFTQRRAVLEQALVPLPMAAELLASGQCRDCVFLINNLSGSPAEMWTMLQAQNARLGRKFYEGLVAKRADSTYPTHAHAPKTRCSAWIKHRFDQ